MTANRRPTSMTLDAALLDEAKSHGINLSRAAEAGILAELKQARAEAWKRDNAEASRVTTLSWKPRVCP